MITRKNILNSLFVGCIAFMFTQAVYAQQSSGGSGIYLPNGTEITKQQINSYFSTNPSEADIANYAVQMGLNEYQVANARAQYAGQTYHEPVWVPAAAATVGGSAGGGTMVGSTYVTGGTGAWGAGACGGRGWGGTSWNQADGYGGYGAGACNGQANVPASYYGATAGVMGEGETSGSDGNTYYCKFNGFVWTPETVVSKGVPTGYCKFVRSGTTPVTTGNSSGGSLVTGTDGNTYSCIVGRAFTASSVVTDGVKSGFCKIVSAGVTNNTTTNTITSRSSLLSDEDPTGSSSSCVELTSTALRYQAKDVNTNGEVTTLQTFLNDNNYLPTAPTGFFGAGTLKAVKAFQSANGINPTGFVGPNTRSVIKTVSCSSVVSGSATIPDNYSPVTTSLPAGCTSSTGFSRTTGLSCASSFPAGCDSASGYSVTTGVKCSQ